ncbi:MAG: tetratricopeptide repeat-containing S1 family peptidase [Thiobacillus sp.]
MAAELDKSNLIASVVVLKSDEALRSAVVVAPQTVVSTCSIKYQLVPLSVIQKGISYPAELQYVDPFRGLCQYTVANLPAMPVEKGSARNLKIKSKVRVVGAQDDDEVTIATGVVRAVRPFEESNYIQLSVPITPKLSGAGVFNSAGELIGITQFYLSDADLNFALPVEWLVEIPKRAMGYRKFVFTDGPASRLKWMNKAILLEKKSDWRGLEKHAKRWTKLDAKDRWGWLSLASAYVNQAQFQKAIPAYETALRLSPNYGAAWNNLGTAYQRVGSYQKAIMAYEVATRLDPQSASAWFNLGAALQHEKQHQQAIYAYREAGILEPDKPAIWYNLGISYAELNQLTAAALAYQQALKLQPDHRNAKHNLGLIDRGGAEFPAE